MFFTKNFNVGLSMISRDMHITNKSFLSLLQDIAEMHSASIGHGVTNVVQTKLSWALLNWKVKIITRPKYGDTVSIKTWARYHTRSYCYRDFEVTDNSGNTIAIATSKWVLFDVVNQRIAKLDDEFINLYQPENKSVFDEVEIAKISEPDSYTSLTNCKIRKCDIDINNHVNNLCYLDIALEGFPNSDIIFNSYNEIEILYRHQIKLDDAIYIGYALVDNINYLVLKDANTQAVHSIIKLK